MAEAFDPLTSPDVMSQVTAVVSYLATPGNDATRVGLGVTKGGASLDVNPKRREAEYDGKRHRATRTSQIVEYSSSITGTFVTFSDEIIAAMMAGSETTAGITTPQAANLALTEGQYLDKVWYQMFMPDGTSRVWQFDKGLVVEPAIDTKDKDESTIKIRIDAYVDSTRSDYSSTLPDFTYFKLDAAGAVIV